MQKLPISRKQLNGTDRPDKDRQGVQAGEALQDVPSPPEHLSERACKAWEIIAAEVVALGVLTSADLSALALLCETQATASELEETIRAEGFTVSTGAGGQKAHPALKALESTRNALARMLQQFGLTPAARKFVEQARTPTKQDRDDGPQPIPR